MFSFFRRGKNKGGFTNVEVHFWTLTRYRIGRHFLGLDYAGNVICYPAYRKQIIGGWGAVTLGSSVTGSTSFFVPDTSNVNVLEDGYPLHWRATRKLQTFIQAERKSFHDKREQELIKKVAAEVAAATAAGAKAAAGEGTAQTAPNATEKERLKKLEEEIMEKAKAEEEAANRNSNVYGAEQHFADQLTTRCSGQAFVSRFLRLSRIATFAYKCLYFYLWFVAFYALGLMYAAFREWLNPPARQGLKNLEDHAMHIPRMIAGGIKHFTQPAVDATRNALIRLIPALNNYALFNPEATKSIIPSWLRLSTYTSKLRSGKKSNEPSKEEAGSASAKRLKSTVSATKTKFNDFFGGDENWYSRIAAVLMVLFLILNIL